MLLTYLNNIPDKRRDQAKQYQQGYLLLFTILAILSGARSYREIEIFTKEHFKRLKKRFKLKWKTPPSYSTFRRAIKNLSTQSLEKGFRNFNSQFINRGSKHISIDGKTLRGSFDNFNDKQAVQVLSAFLADKDLIIAHEETRRDKTNEIPLLQNMLRELGITGKVITSDALHCQKKL